MPSRSKFDPRKNQFLEGLPDEELKTLRPHLHLVSGKSGDVLFGAGDPIQNLYFPLTASVSINTNFQEGRGVEVALIGSEGLAGVWAANGSHASWHEAVVQVSGDLLKINAGVFRAEFHRSAAIRDQLHRYMLFLIAEVSQTAACNRLHPVKQRLARWLLMTHDQVRTNEFRQTHEFLSHLLGRDRSQVTLAVGILRKAGLISYSRGKVKILDRKGLEEASCECYRIVLNESIRLREKRN